MSTNSFDNQQEQHLSGGQRLLSLDNLGDFDSQIKTPQSQRKKINSRTPSGNILTNQVQSVRVFFSPKERSRNSKVVKDKENTYSECENQHQHDNASLKVKDVVSGATNTILRESSEPELSKQTNYHDQSQIGTGARKKRRLTLSSNDEMDKSKEMEVESDTDCNREEDAQLEEMDINKILQDCGISETAKSVDVRTVLKMFQKLQQSFDGSKSEEKLKKLVESEVTDAFAVQEKRIEKLEADLRQSNRKSKLMQELLLYNNSVMKDMTRRLDILELANARKMAILTGMSFRQKKADKIADIADFFYKELEVYTRIEDAYSLGSYESSPTVIVFQTMEDKNTVFNKKAGLKDIGKTLGKTIYLNHYLPSKENEKRKRERRIASDLKASEEEKKPEISYKKGLCIGNDVYKKKVTPPDPTDLLKYSVPELDVIMEKKTMKGNQLHEGDSVFIPYAIDTKDFQSIRDVYMKLRLIHTTARHIVCAYHLPGADSKLHENSDSCDDEEYGAGPALLREMVKSNIFNKAFFIVRYCGQDKLSTNRLSSYIKAAKGLLLQKPYNSIIDRKQFFKEEGEEEGEKPKGVRYQYKNKEERKSMGHNSSRDAPTAGRGRGKYK